VRILAAVFVVLLLAAVGWYGARHSSSRVVLKEKIGSMTFEVTELPDQSLLADLVSKPKTYFYRFALKRANHELSSFLIFAESERFEKFRITSTVLDRPATAIRIECAVSDSTRILCMADPFWGFEWRRHQLKK
jgi:hypothetical protein